MCMFLLCCYTHQGQIILSTLVFRLAEPHFREEIWRNCICLCTCQFGSLVFSFQLNPFCLIITDGLCWQPLRRMGVRAGNLCDPHGLSWVEAMVLFWAKVMTNPTPAAAKCQTHDSGLSDTSTLLHSRWRRVFQWHQPGAGRWLWQRFQ